MRIFFFLLVLTFTQLFAGQRYEARTLVEVQAQIRLINELENKGLLSTENASQEQKRLARISHDITYGQAPVIVQEAENIVTTQKFDWLSTGLLTLASLIGLFVMFPLLKKLFRHFRRVVIYSKKYIRKFYFKFKKLFWWLPKLIDTIRKIIELFFDTLEYLWKKVFVVLQHIVTFIQKQPFWIKELLLYIIYISVLVSVENFYLRLIVVIFMTATLPQSIIHHYTDKTESKRFMYAMLFMSTLLWGISAYVFESSLMGFVTVGVFNALLGFGFAILPGQISMGFVKHSQINTFRVSLISLSLLLVGWLIFYSRLLPHSVATEVFMYEAGLYFFVALGFYTAILIISGIWYERAKHYLFYNMYAFFMGLSLLFLSYLYSMGFLFWIGAIFMVWFLVSKFYELIWKHSQHVYALTLIALILGALGYTIQNYLEELTHFFGPIL